MDLENTLYPHFIEGEWYIFPNRERDLERLTLFMKNNPKMNVELNFHSSVPIHNNRNN